VDIHDAGAATVAVLPFEIAEQKVIDATNMARLNGYPLILKAEAE
jgi:ATP-dependent Clp protease adapter protein ClpS